MSLFGATLLKGVRMINDATRNQLAITNRDLLAALKALRRSIAAELGKPAYIVFGDASLLDMAQKQPVNIYEFRLVNGVGDHKATQFGKAFLEAIAAWRARSR
jgi:ATP-dependent DNA helicase RecQ